MAIYTTLILLAARFILSLFAALHSNLYDFHQLYLAEWQVADFVICTHQLACVRVICVERDTQHPDSCHMLFWYVPPLQLLIPKPHNRTHLLVQRM